MTRKGAINKLIGMGNEKKKRSLFMFELYDMVYTNNNCTDQNLKGRVGLVFGVSRVKKLVHVAFDLLDYVVTVPESWLYKEGVLCQRDRNAEMQRYIPGRFIRRRNTSEVDKVGFIEFTWHGTYELDGSFSCGIIYSAFVHTKSGQIYDAYGLRNFDDIGDCPVKDYSSVITPYDVMKCCHNDIFFTEQATKDLLNSIYGINSKTLKEEIQMKTQSQSACNPIKKVIFNDPATIVFWNDGAKTVVQARGEAFDPEKGLAMAICRHYLCDICHLEEYHGLFEKHLKGYRKPNTGYGYNVTETIVDGFGIVKKTNYDMLSRLMDGNVQEIIK